MRNEKMRGEILLLLCAFIWGTSFVVQRTAMDHVGPFTFVALRFLMAAVALVPVALLFDKEALSTLRKDRAARSALLTGGLACGGMISLAAMLQQYGLQYTSSGKAGFITSLYLVIVAVVSFFAGGQHSAITWVSVGLAVVGLYLLSVKEGFSVQLGDLIVFVGAFFWAGHIMVIDHFSKKVPPVALSCLQFLFGGLVALVLMLLLEKPTVATVSAAVPHLLYAAVVVSGVAYTLQILGQRTTPPTTASLLMSLEAVFAALAGALLLAERMSTKEFLGCVLVFAAVLLPQLPQKKQQIN